MKKAIILGFIFGLVVLPLGLFIGLQVSGVIANILLFPIIIFSSLSGIFFGDTNLLQKIIIFAISGISWAIVFVLILKIKQILIKKAKD